MNFSPRLRQILLILLHEDQVMPVKKLAEDIKVSKRTVWRDVYDEELAYELKQDEEFIVGLLAHLQPTFVRLKIT